ncbi:MAG: 2-hydroxychromene-2-carboxylate isomerase [Burkholderiales bacterium]|nr:2-hydroxychromene-2-carboxylate isomerase [Burkholderiales bacterium]
MTATLDFYFDYGSPAAYLAWTQVPALARRTGARVNYHPILLGGVFQATGNRSPAEVPAKLAWMFRDLQWFAARYGVPFARNPHFPVNTLGLMRGAVYAQQQGFLEPYSDAVFRALWAERRNLGDRKELSRTLGEAGLDGERILAAMQDPAIKEALRAATDAAVRRGVFGVPTFFVGNQMHFGQDRLPYVEELLVPV